MDLLDPMLLGLYQAPLTLPLGRGLIPHRLTHVRHCVSRAAHFYTHLCRRPAPNAPTLEQTVKFEVYPLPRTRLSHHLESGMNDGNVGGHVELQSSGEERYLGFRVLNLSRVPLYAYLFYFCNDDLSIGEPLLFIWCFSSKY